MIKPLGGVYYHFALSIALFFEYRFSRKYRNLLRVLLNIFIKYLIKKDKKTIQESFQNGQLYSGLYGVIIK